MSEVLEPRDTAWGVTRCPNEPHWWCPLSVAMLVAGRPSCDDGRLDEGGCAVDRGGDYHQLLGELMAIDPRLVAEARWHGKLDQRRRQRHRNLQANGIH